MLVKAPSGLRSSMLGIIKDGCGHPEQRFTQVGVGRDANSLSSLLDPDLSSINVNIKIGLLLIKTPTRR